MFLKEIMLIILMILINFNEIANRDNSTDLVAFSLIIRIWFELKKKKNQLDSLGF